METNVELVTSDTSVNLKQSKLSILGQSTFKKATKPNLEFNAPNLPLKSNPNRILIGKELGKIASGYKTYGEYFKNHSSCEKLLGNLNKNESHEMKEIEKGLREYLSAIDPKKENATINDCL